MSKVEDFLTATQEQEVIQTIRLAEKNTSGEIRVHLEKSTDKDPLERAEEVFYFLKMDETIAHNGVLIYVAVDDKKISIIGDKGINDAVPNTFWNSIKDHTLTYFKKGEYTEGLKQGITEIGDKLQQYFPFLQDDTNELSDTISKS